MMMPRNQIHIINFLDLSFNLAKLCWGAGSLEVYLIKVEVSPLRNSNMYEDDPKIKGAFVYCVIAADNKDTAEKDTQNNLLINGYKMISIEDICIFTEFKWDNEQDEMQFKAMAWDALMNRGFGIGPFYCYYDS